MRGDRSQSTVHIVRALAGEPSVWEFVYIAAAAVELHSGLRALARLGLLSNLESQKSRKPRDFLLRLQRLQFGNGCHDVVEGRSILIPLLGKLGLDHSVWPDQENTGIRNAVYAVP